MGIVVWYRSSILKTDSVSRFFNAFQHYLLWHDTTCQDKMFSMRWDMHYLQKTLHTPGILCSKHRYNRSISEILRHPGNIISHVLGFLSPGWGYKYKCWNTSGKGSFLVYMRFTVQIFRPKGDRYFCYILFIKKINYPQGVRIGFERNKKRTIKY